MVVMEVVVVEVLAKEGANRGNSSSDISCSSRSRNSSSSSTSERKSRLIITLL